MKQFIYKSLILGSALIAASCNSAYEFDQLFPQEYHKILYVKYNGKQEMNMNTVETTPVYSINVIKAGSDPSLTAHVKLSVMTQQEVDASYGLLDNIGLFLPIHTRWLQRNSTSSRRRCRRSWILFFIPT